MRAARTLAHFIEEVLAPRIIGLPVGAPERPWADLFQETLLLGRRGFAIRAISAIDIALWDLLGKLAGLPLYNILGGVRDTVPAYASGGYYRPGDPLKNLENELSRYCALGFTDVKIKIGGLDSAVDAARVKLARELVGPNGRVALDANNRWKYAFEAVAFIRSVERYDPWWVEEPLAPDDIAGHRAIAQAVDVPIATGEIHSTRWDFRQLIDAVDILQPDAAVVGGIAEWMRIAHSAETFGMPVAPHWNADIHVHLAGAVANCLAVEWFDLEQDIVNFEKLLAERLRPVAGQIKIPERPGLGLLLDGDAIERYRMPSLS
jgi:L-alanine-DL-glutamate epimerase-like enolase superfamily enzyme